MARIILDAEAAGGDTNASGIAASGNVLPLRIMVSASRSNGTPATGLSVANFGVDPRIVGAGGGGVTLTTVDERPPGIYILEVVPIATTTWRPARYLFWLKANKGADAGQTVFAADIT
jgi:hypothetical protein